MVTARAIGDRITALYDEYGVASGFTFTSTTNIAITQGFLTVTDLDPNFGGISLSAKISLEE